MAVPMIAESIYTGATAEDLGIPEAQYRNRKEVLDRFLAVWPGGDFKKDYLAWLKTQEEGQSAGQTIVVGSAADEPQAATAADMARNAAGAVKRALRSGFKRVPEAEQQRRLQLCQQCPQWTGSRCKVCGCFGALKTRLATEHCPINKW